MITVLDDDFRDEDGDDRADGRRLVSSSRLSHGLSLIRGRTMGDWSDMPDLSERCFILDGLITFSLVMEDEGAILLELQPTSSIVIPWSLSDLYRRIFIGGD